MCVCRLADWLGWRAALSVYPPLLRGKVAIVTGANAGLGLETTKALLQVRMQCACTPMHAGGRARVCVCCSGGAPKRRGALHVAATRPSKGMRVRNARAFATYQCALMPPPLTLLPMTHALHVVPVALQQGATVVMACRSQVRAFLAVKVAAHGRWGAMATCMAGLYRPAKRDAAVACVCCLFATLHMLMLL